MSAARRLGRSRSIPELNGLRPGLPAVGVVGSVVLLGERPTLAEIAGFVLILCASACVLLAPGGETEMAAEPT